MIDESRLEWEVVKEEDIITPGGGTGGGVTWEQLKNKPETFPPSSHGHSANEISDLPTSLPANGGSANALNVIDSRNENYPPSYYFGLGRKEVNEFKIRAVVENPPVSITGNFVYVKTICGWIDSTGGYPVQIAYGTQGLAFRTGKSNDEWNPWIKLNETHWSDIQGKPAAMPANGGNADTVGGRGVDSLVLINRHDFWVDGDAHTYYPVVIRGAVGSNFFGAQLVYIYRRYSEAAPNTWNTSTHRGGLDVKIETFLSGWGGQLYYMDILLGQTYTNVIANLEVAGPDTNTIIAWLRGGTAIYHIQTTAPNLSVTPVIGTYRHMPDTQYERVYEPTTTIETVFQRVNHRRRILCGPDMWSTTTFSLPKTATKQF